MDLIPQPSIATVDASVSAPPRDPPPFQKTERRWGGLGLEDEKDFSNELADSQVRRESL